MNQQIMAFEEACKTTYNSKLEDKTLGPKLWVVKAIENKLFQNHDGGFTRMNGARQLVSQIDEDVIL